MNMYKVYDSFVKRRFNNQYIMIPPNTTLPSFDTGIKIDTLHVSYDFKDSNSLNLFKLKDPESYERLVVIIYHMEK